MRPGRASGAVTVEDDDARESDQLRGTVGFLATPDRHVFQEASTRRAAAQLELFAVRCSEMADRIAAREIGFIDAVDMLYSAAIWSGLIDGVGDDFVQLVMAAAFLPMRENADAS
jgi:hypothetical protein